MKLIENASREKLRGGFYTPEPIVKFILKWAMNGNQRYDILEPSCGDGIFLRQIKENRFDYKSLTAIEIDKNETKKACNIFMPNVAVLNEDFYQYYNSTKDRFDLAIGNPPYIRYQYFSKKQQLGAEKIFFDAGLKYTKLTNAWVSFVVGVSLLLKEKGKIGLVLPAELLQVSYAKPLRSFLARFYNKISIVSFRKLVIPNIQQEVLLLLCEKNGSGSHLIEHLEVEDASELKKIDVTKLKAPKKKIDFKSNKWTFYFLEQAEINFIEKLLEQKTINNFENNGDGENNKSEFSILPLRNYATAEVGITTGSNKFFTVPISIIEKYELQEYAYPLVGRSVQVNSIIFTEKDWEINSELGARAYFLKFQTRKEIEKKRGASMYVKEGEADEIHKGYKCRIRHEWQIAPSAWVSEALFTRRNNIYPKLIINEANAYTTDTMHRVTTKKDIDLRAFTASYYNSLSFAFAEICGRSYGGGVLELMPNEVENILIPYHVDNAKILDLIDKEMREKKSIDEILRLTDKIILKERFNFSASEIKLANSIWKKLVMRRLNRNNSYSNSIKKGSF